MSESEIFILDDHDEKWKDSDKKKSDKSQEEKKQDDEISLSDKINNYLANMQSLKVKDKVVFYRLTATMLNAWISLMKSIQILEKQEKNPVMKNVLQKFYNELKWWKWLSECFAMFPKNFSDAEIWIIESWEKTWRLNQAMTSLADQIEKLASMNWKLKWAMMYPLMVIFVVVWVIFVMMIMIVPKLLEIFWYDPWLPIDATINVEAMAKLPASTNLLIKTSNFFTSYWYLLIGWAFWLMSFINIWKRTPSWMYNYDKIMLKIPVFWDINQKMVLSKFARVLSSLIEWWVSIVEWLRITSEAVWNEVYRQRIMLLRDDVKQWLKIRESLEWDPLFPEIMVQMVQVWEQTAKLWSIIIKVADFYDEEVDNVIWTINKLLEPFIIVFMAIVVWWIAVAIMQPIMWLADQVAKW